MRLTLLQNVFVEGLGSESRWIFPRLRGDVVTVGENAGILAPALLCPSAALTSPAGTEPQIPQLPALALGDVISKHPNCSPPPKRNILI